MYIHIYIYIYICIYIYIYIYIISLQGTPELLTDSSPKAATGLDGWLTRLRL